MFSQEGKFLHQVLQEVKAGFRAFDLGQYVEKQDEILVEVLGN